MTLKRPLISAAELLSLTAQGTPVRLLDCSFELTDTEAGRRSHIQAHLPGALYAHLDEDLSGPKTTRGAIDGGRHPLPSRAVLARRIGAWGIEPGTMVVTYDRQGGPYAARAWWLLRWLGHTHVAVLDGGLEAWRAVGGPLEAGPVAPAAAAGDYPMSEPAMPTVSADELLHGAGRHLVLDARAPERFRGDVEPLDSRAGHIPGARNHFFKHNLAADGCFLPADELRARFDACGTTPDRIVHQCGSGVTACHNLLAMTVAGLAGSALYPGSWSEWSADASRPVATGGPALI